MQEGEDDQGVGPHYDAGFLTFVGSVSITPRIELTHWWTAPSSIWPSGSSSAEFGRRMDRRTSDSRNLRGQYRQRYVSSSFRNGSSYQSHLALEFATSGLARATSHRVLSPHFSPEHSGPRYSVPFFQNISLEAKLVDLKEGLKCAHISSSRRKLDLLTADPSFP